MSQCVQCARVYLKPKQNTRTRKVTTLLRKLVDHVPCTSSVNNICWGPTKRQKTHKNTFLCAMVSYELLILYSRTSFTEQSHEADSIKSSVEF